MPMHDPPHPGEFIREIYLEPNGLSARSVARSLGIAPSTFARLVAGTSGVTPEMALRLSRALGRSPESWMAMQDRHDLWHAQRRIDLDHVQPIELVGDTG